MKRILNIYHHIWFPGLSQLEWRTTWWVENMCLVHVRQKKPHRFAGASRYARYQHACEVGNIFALFTSEVRLTGHSRMSWLYK